MSSWFSLSLGDGISAAIPSNEIDEQFQRAFPLAGSPPEMAIFVRSETEGRLHCEVIAYFSPAAGELAEAFEASPCLQPVRAGLSLLAGSQGAWSALFDDNA